MTEILQTTPHDLPRDDWPIVLEGPVRGVLNGFRLEGFARTAVHLDSNVYATMIAVDDVPELGNALMSISCTSVKTSVGGIFAPAKDGAVKLVDLMSMPFRVDVAYNHVDDNGKEIGQVRQSIEISQVGPGRYLATPEFEGWYEGPKDIRRSPGYAIYLRQAGPGVIEGLYSQTIIADSGRCHALVRRRYQYQSDKVLPADQVWHYKLLKDVDVHIEDGLRVFESRMSAYHSPAEGEHGAFPEDDYRRMLPGAREAMAALG